MTDFERAKEIIKANDFHTAKHYFKNDDYFSRTTEYYFDYSKRTLKLIFFENNKGEYSFNLRIFFGDRFYRTDGITYYVDGTDVSEETFFESLKLSTVPKKKRKNEQYTQLEMNFNATDLFEDDPCSKCIYGKMKDCANYSCKEGLRAWAKST